MGVLYKAYTWYQGKIDQPLVMWSFQSGFYLMLLIGD